MATLQGELMLQQGALRARFPLTSWNGSACPLEGWDWRKVTM